MAPTKLHHRVPIKQRLNMPSANNIVKGQLSDSRRADQENGCVSRRPANEHIDIANPELGGGRIEGFFGTQREVPSLAVFGADGSRKQS